MQPRNCGSWVNGQSADAASRIASLDGLRGLAILFVVAAHLAIAAQQLGLWHESMRVTLKGWIGVDLFLVLSGYLVTGGLYDSRDRSGYFRRFYTRRIVRIFPLYYAALCVVLATELVARVIYLHQRPGAQFWLGQLSLWTYTSNLYIAWTGHHVPSAVLNVAHFWYLAAQEQFYLLWPLAVYFLSRKTCMRICAALMVAALLLRTGLRLSGTLPAAPFFFTACRADALAAGAWLALYLRGPRPRHAHIYCAAAMIFAAAELLVLWSFQHNLRVDSFAVETLGFTCVALMSASLVGLLALRPASGLVSLALSFPALKVVGKYSYGLYVYHFLLLPPIIELCRRTRWLGAADPLESFPLFVVVYAGIVGLVTVASFHLFEQRVVALFKQTTASKPPLR